MRSAETQRRGAPWLGMALGVLTLAAALATVILSYQNRILYREWQSELARSETLEVEWRRLLLEESAWLGRARIEKLARDELGMIAPREGGIAALRLGPERGP